MYNYWEWKVLCSHFSLQKRGPDQATHPNIVALQYYLLQGIFFILIEYSSEGLWAGYQLQSLFRFLKVDAF